MLLQKVCSCALVEVMLTNKISKPPINTIIKIYSQKEDCTMFLMEAIIINPLKGTKIKLLKKEDL
jgi:hypothetical protein